MVKINHPNRPCSECPWRRDVPVGQFDPERYIALESTSRGPDGHPMLGDPLFACHKTKEGAELACAGWLAVEGLDHLNIRLALATGQLVWEDVLKPEGWPELYSSYTEMAAANGVKREAVMPEFYEEVDAQSFADFPNSIILENDTSDEVGKPALRLRIHTQGAAPDESVVLSDDNIRDLRLALTRYERMRKEQRL